jgi:hypothetical protein
MNLSTKAVDHNDVDPRLAEEVRAINAAFDLATKALEADRKSLPAKSAGPVQIATFDC